MCKLRGQKFKENLLAEHISCDKNVEDEIKVLHGTSFNEKNICIFDAA